jgi:hypothetical protein
MLACVGLNLGAIDGKGDLANFKHPHLYGHCEDLLKAAFEQRVIGPAEGADAIVIGVKVCAKQTHRHVLVGGAFNLPTAESARRVGIDKQAKHQGRRILAAASPSFVDLGLAQIDQADRLHNGMHQVILRLPPPQIRGHQQRSIVVNTDKPSRHT